MSQVTKRGSGGSPTTGIETINGDIGSITGSTVTIYADHAANNAGSSVLFNNSGTISTLKVTDSGVNTLLGQLTGNLSLTGTGNTGFGYSVMNGLTTGSSNTAIGFSAMTSLTTGNDNVCVGTNSISVTTGSENTILNANTAKIQTGSFNIVMGENTTGSGMNGANSSNIYFCNAGANENNTIRIGTTGTGDAQQSTCYIAGIASVAVSNTNMVTIDTTTGQLGSQAVPSGGSVTIAGDSGSISGSNLTIFANQNPTENAGSTVQFLGSGTTMTFNVTDASGNTMIGQAAGNLTTTGSVNTGIGFQALNVVTSGVQNTAVGYDAMVLLQDGVANTAVGYSALASNVSGNFNTAVGDQCLVNCASSNNTAVGNLCFSGLNDANNVGVGYAVGASQTSGQNNTYVGMISGNLVVSGSNNTFLGYNSGSSFTTSDSNNISIGFGVTGSAGTNDEIRIGNSSNTTCFIQGISGVTVTGAAVLCDATGKLGTVVSSARYKDNIVDMPENLSVLNLRPIQFNYKASSEIQYGLLAEQVHETFPYLCLYNKTGEPDSVKYHELCTFLLAEIQRMDKRIKALH